MTSDFEFAGPECERCGAFLDSESDDCNECSDKELSRYHFEHISNDSVETVWAINGIRAWHELMTKVDEPLPWRCVETGDLSVDMAQRGHDVKEIYEEENDET